MIGLPACLGVGGAAAAPKYELTEIGLPYGEKPEGRKLYKDWRVGNDFPVNKAQAHNPTGINAKPYPEKRDGIIPKNGMETVDVVQNGDGPSRKWGWKRSFPVRWSSP